MKIFQNVIKDIQFKTGAAENEDLRVKNLKGKCENLIHINTAKLEETQRELNYLTSTLTLLEKIHTTLESLERKEDNNE